MDSSWKRSIDQTLQNTRATLKRLQERHAQHDVAKRRVDEAFGAASPPDRAGGAADVSRNRRQSWDLPDASPLLDRSSSLAARGNAAGPVPPPLPPSRGLRSGLAAAHLPERAAATNVSSALLWDSYAFTPTTGKELADAFRVMKAQLRGLTVELELERTVRADGQREMAASHAKQISDLRTAVRLLQEENAFLKDSVRALESRTAFGSGIGGGPFSAVHDTHNGSTYPRYASHLTGGSGGRSQRSYAVGVGGYSHLDDAKSTFIGHVQASPGEEGVAASAGDERVRQRVADLEDRIQRQQRLLDDRQGRVDHLVKDMVDARVGAEVERMRGIAREAARDATEDLVRVRLSAVQSMFHDELRTVLEKTGVTEEVSRATEKLFRQHERDWIHKWSSLQDAVAALQQHADAADNASDRLTEWQRKASSELDALTSGLAAAQRDGQEAHLRLSQTTSARLESARVELLATVQRQLQEQQQQLRQDGFLVRESDVHRIVEGSVGPIASRLESLDAAVRRNREAQEEARRQALHAHGELATEVAHNAERSADLQRAFDGRTAEWERLRSDVASAKVVAADARVGAENAALTAEEALTLVKRLQERYHEETGKLDAQVRRLTAAQDAAKEQAQTLSAEKDTLSERVAELENSLRAMEASVPRTVQPLAAKVESVHKALHQTCLPALETLQEGLTEATARVQQTQDAKKSDDRQVAQQLSDLRKLVETKGREVESRLRRDMDEGQMRTDTQMDALAKRVAAHAKTQQTLAASAVDRADELAGRLAKLEAAASESFRTSEEPDERAAPTDRATVVAGFTADAATALLSSQKDWLAQRLEAAEKRSVERLQQEVAAVREEQREALRHQADMAAQRVSDLQAQVKRVEAAVQERAEAMEERLTEAEAHTRARLAAAQERMKELVSPQRLVSMLVGDDACVEQLASHLHPKLLSSGETVLALGELRVALRAVEQRVQEQRDRLAAMSEVRTRVEGNSDAGAASGSLLQSRLSALEEGTEQSVQQVQRLAKDAQQSARDCHARLEELAPSLQLRLTAVEASCRELLGSYANVMGIIQQCVQAAVEAERAEREAALQPVDAKVRFLEEQSAALRSAQERVRDDVGRQEEAEMERRRLLDEILAKLAGLQTALDTQQDAMLREYLHPLQAHVARLGKELEEVREQHASAPSSSAGKSGADGLLGQDASDVVARLEALEKFAESVEGSGEEGLLATADALAALRDGLQLCIDKAGDYLRKDHAAADAPLPTFSALDDLFLFLLGQISSIHNALGTLQQNAVATLELIQQQELDVLAIPALQEAVLQLSENMKPIAVAAGVDPELFHLVLPAHAVSETAASCE